MSVCKNNKTILWAYCLIILALIIIMVIYDKASIHIFINRYHNNLSDGFFKIATNLGNGVFIASLSILILLFWKVKYGLYNLSVYIFSGIFVQLSKRIVWPSAKRPYSFFEDGILHVVEGMKMLNNHGFPSGHTASAFGLFFCLAFLVKKEWAKWMFFTLACLTGFSRIYLSQHFLHDVVIGSIIGVFSAIVMFKLFEKTQVVWMDKKIMKFNDKS